MSVVEPAAGLPPEIRSARYEIVDVDSIEPHPGNVNEGDVGAICESLDALGFYGACLVQESRRWIVAGKHRWLAARQSGMVEIPALITDVDDETAVRIMLGDNRIARLGRDDPTRLTERLLELAARPLALRGTGFDADDLDRLRRGLDVEPPPMFPSVGAVDTEHRCPSCGYEWSGSPRP